MKYWCPVCGMYDDWHLRGCPNQPEMIRLREEVEELKGAIKLIIGRNIGVPWPEVPDEEVEGCVKEWRKISRRGKYEL